MPCGTASFPWTNERVPSWGSDRLFEYSYGCPAVPQATYDEGVSPGRKDDILLDGVQDRSVTLPQEIVRQIEELRRRTGKESGLEVLREALAGYARLHAPAEVAAYKALPLRLRQVLRLIAEGDSNKAMAAKLGVSVKTVEFHRAQLVKKLGIRSIAGLVCFAVRVGVILP
jgi:DNA-binding NarL/FixJ family response regulator